MVARLRISGLSLLLIAAGGCAPVVSGVQIVNANIAISAAETAGAKGGKAPADVIFQHTTASEYLRKAREEYGYSDFAAARRYADKALDAAVKARRAAEAASKLDQPAVLPPQ